MSDTIAAVATGGSVSAIGIVRVSGSLSAPLMDALFRPADGKAMSQHRDRQLVYGKLLDEKGRTLDLCLCTLSRAPRSYTGEDTAELQCHGSPVVLRAALEASPETEFFAVQDGARPLVTVELIDEVLDAARVYLAAAPAVPVRDTIKVAHDGIVERTPDRSALFAVQTPQVFAADLLKAALQSAVESQIPITDDCSAVERLGKVVFLVEGDEENLKITTPVDLILAEAILQAREER